LLVNTLNIRKCTISVTYGNIHFHFDLHFRYFDLRDFNGGCACFKRTHSVRVLCSLHCFVQYIGTSSYKLSDVTKDGTAGRNVLQCNEMCLSELSAHFFPPIAIHFRFCTVITWRAGPVALSLVLYYSDLVNPNM